MPSPDRDQSIPELLAKVSRELRNREKPFFLPTPEDFWEAGVANVSVLRSALRRDHGKALYQRLGVKDVSVKMYIHTNVVGTDGVLASGNDGQDATRGRRRTGSSSGAEKVAVAAGHGFKLNTSNMYRSVDINGEWWPVTLLGINDDGTYRAKVHDSTGKIWEKVLPQHIRDAEAIRETEGCAGYNSRERTGFIGLRNQGATCYLNSLLQCLFHLSYFRTGIYNMDTREDEDPSQCIPLALQRLFYALEFRMEPASTRELTASFGWGARQAAVQHDIQELLRVLSDTLRDKMLLQGIQHNSIDKLFRGEHAYFVRTTDGSDYSSTRLEQFYDLTLVVRGNRDIYQAFEQYCEKDILDGENKYQVEHDDGTKTKHPAERGCIFKTLPPVLILHLRRFDFDPQLLREAKVNDEFRFYEEIDLTRFVDPHADNPRKAFSPPTSGANSPTHSPTAESRPHDMMSVGSGNTLCLPPAESHRYVLHSVMVHGGGLYGGHYTCYVRPNGGEQWFEFDDETVVSSSEDTSIKGNYGGKLTDSWGVSRDRSSSAYLLMYVRKQVSSRIVYPPREEEKPTHLRERFERDARRREREREEGRQRRKRVTVLVVLDENLSPSQPMGLVRHDQIPEQQRIVLQRQANTIGQLVDITAERAGVSDARCLRLWRNGSKGDFPLTDLSATIEEALSPSTGAHAEVLVYGERLQSPLPAELPSEEGRVLLDRIVYIKRYDPKDPQPLTFLCSFTFPTGDDRESPTVSDLSAHANKTLGRDAGAPLAMWYEDIFPQLRPLECPDLPVAPPHLRSGSVVVVQPAHSDEHAEKLFEGEALTDEASMPSTAPGFYLQESLRVEVEFRQLGGEESDQPIRLILLKTFSYEGVQQRLAAAAKIAESQQSHIRLTRHNATWERPESGPLRISGGYNLGRMLGAQQRQEGLPPILWWELLGQPVAEVELKLTLRVAVYDDRMRLICNETLVLPPAEQCTVGDVVRMLQERHKKGDGVEGSWLASSRPEDLCLVEIRNSIIVAVNRCDARGAPRVRQWRDSFWRVEPCIRPLLSSTGEPLSGQRTLTCAHFERGADVYGSLTLHFHSEPFLLRVLDSDSVQTLLSRVESRLGLGVEEGDPRAAGGGGAAAGQAVRTWGVGVYYAGQMEMLETGEGAAPVWEQIVSMLGGGYVGARGPHLVFEHRRAPRRQRQIAVKICEGGRSG
eukprot:Hpha_TRINITY_DN16625_c4_g4::TRINITY_DN16625_c4_g4_i1::g.182932::m.182932/K11838/USP7, UBP15; ubiquitin carboxyl-terminal hydrolase 7